MQTLSISMVQVLEGQLNGFWLENDNGFCNLVFLKINEMYPNMRIITATRKEWESFYVPLIGQKYSNIRCNLSNDIQSQYFGKF